MSSASVIDQKARDMAQAAQHQIQSHEDQCALRWSSTMTTMAEIKRILAWGTVSLIAAMAGLISFLATHQITH